MRITIEQARLFIEALRGIVENDSRCVAIVVPGSYIVEGHFSDEDFQSAIETMFLKDAQEKARLAEENLVDAVQNAILNLRKEPAHFIDAKDNIEHFLMELHRCLMELGEKSIP